MGASGVPSLLSDPGGGTAAAAEAVSSPWPVHQRHMTPLTDPIG